LRFETGRADEGVSKGLKNLKKNPKTENLFADFSETEAFFGKISILDHFRD
jgi:hypothetical protein